MPYLKKSTLMTVGTVIVILSLALGIFFTLMLSDKITDKLTWSHIFGFIQFLLGSFVLGFIALAINNKIQEKRLDIQEMQFLSEFKKIIVHEDPRLRKQIAEYYLTLSPSPDTRKRWEEYLDNYIDKEIEEVTKLTKEIESLKKEIDFKDAKQSELNSKLEEIREKESQLNTLKKSKSFSGYFIPENVNFSHYISDVIDHEGDEYKHIVKYAILSPNTKLLLKKLYEPKVQFVLKAPNYEGVVHYDSFFDEFIISETYVDKNESKDETR